jgi:hypothetical protein
MDSHLSDSASCVALSGRLERLLGTPGTRKSLVP